MPAPRPPAAVPRCLPLPAASRFLLSASRFLLSASRFLLSASRFLLSASHFLLDRRDPLLARRGSPARNTSAPCSHDAIPCSKHLGPLVTRLDPRSHDTIPCSKHLSPLLARQPSPARTTASPAPSMAVPCSGDEIPLGIGKTEQGTPSPRARDGTSASPGRECRSKDSRMNQAGIARNLRPARAVSAAQPGCSRRLGIPRARLHQAWSWATERSFSFSCAMQNQRAPAVLRRVSSQAGQWR
jgi:hypothetical protein